MKNTSLILGAFISLAMVTGCGNANNDNKNSDKKYSDTIDDQGNPIYQDSVNQDSTTVNYRDTTSNIPSGTVPPTSK